MVTTDIAASRETSVLIVGAGLAGLAAGRRLHGAGIDVILLDKGRGVGGRCATRRFESHAFDHGAQFFTVRDPAFAAAVRAWDDAGLVREWFHALPDPPKSSEEDAHPRYCATRGMNSLAKHLAEDLVVRTSTRAVQARRTGAFWEVTVESGEVNRAPTVILTAPMPQSLALLDDETRRALLDECPSLAEVSYEPCFSVMLVLDGPSAIPDPGALRFDGSLIAWMADNTRKRCETGCAAITIHTSTRFTCDHLEASHDAIAAQVIEAARPWLGGQVRRRQVHRWLYSRPVGFAGRPCVNLGAPPHLVLAGDCMLPPSRLEGAYLSGNAAADVLLGVQPH